MLLYSFCKTDCVDPHCRPAGEGVRVVDLHPSARTGKPVRGGGGWKETGVWVGGWVGCGWNREVLGRGIVWGDIGSLCPRCRNSQGCKI